MSPPTYYCSPFTRHPVDGGVHPHVPDGEASRLRLELTEKTARVNSLENALLAARAILDRLPMRPLSRIYDTEVGELWDSIDALRALAVSLPPEPALELNDARPWGAANPPEDGLEPPSRR